MMSKANRRRTAARTLPPIEDFEEPDDDQHLSVFDHQTAFHNHLHTFDIKPRKDTDNLLEFLDQLKSNLKARFLRLLEQQRGFKFEICIEAEYSSVIADEGKKKPVSGYLRTVTQVVTNRFELDQILDKTCQTLMTRNAHFMKELSGLTMNRIHKARLNVSNYSPLAGGMYRELPKFLQRKRAIVNIKNTDNRCFGYAILAALYPVDLHAERPSNYNRYFAREGLNRIQYPVEPERITQIEEALQVQINLYTFFDDEGKGRLPLVISKRNFRRSVDLLYWRGHYAWIRTFSRFAFDVSRNRNPKHFCKRCLGHFVSQAVLDRHSYFCSQHDFPKSIFTLPPAGSVCNFKNIRYQQMVPFVIYADFECLTSPIDQPHAAAAAATSNTVLYQSHTPCSAGLKVISTISDFNNEPYMHYTGKEVMSWFLQKLMQLAEKCLTVLFSEERLIMTPRDQRVFFYATDCYLCKKPFKPDCSDKVRDHDHLTGRFRGAAHNRCNLMLRKTYKIPVFFHNFRGYDSHLIVKALSNFPDIDISVIGQTMEKYMSMGWGQHLTFKDSLLFMNSSLAQLTQNLLDSGKSNFLHLIPEFANDAAEHTVSTADDAVLLLLKKGVYPYDYMTCWERFAETELPARAAFFNKLRNAECSEADYEHAQEVWHRFGCQTIGDYHELYLKADVMQLTDVFENFRNVCMKDYFLDPAHYISSPQLSWDAMLRQSAVELELISDPEMFKMIDGGIRGGVVMISKRFARANNKYLGAALHDASKPTTFINYVDANNLYGWAMSQTLPQHSFKWLVESEWQHLDWTTLTADRATGYFVECDLDYPPELHHLHNDYPLAPERLEINAEMLSETQVRIRRKYSMNRGSSSSKLVPNLLNKRKYTCHYLNLQFYLAKGLKLIKIHRVLEFQQSKWLAGYILLNQALRQQAWNVFLLLFRKLMNNCIFGKTCENQKNRTDIKLVTSDSKRKRLTEKPHCKGFRIFGENLAAVEMQKQQCYINKPFYVGFAVLELSKLHMFRFHYDHIKKLYGSKAQLLFTDTDSLMYEIQTDDVYEDMWKHRDLYDLTSLPVSSGFHDATNNKVIGKFSVETGFDPVLELVALRPKMYSFLTVKSANGNLPATTVEKLRVKGIAQATVRELKHSDFLSQLRQPVENYLLNRRIGSNLHNIYTIEVSKRGLCSFDDKRFLLDDGVNSLAYGHRDIASQVETVDIDECEGGSGEQIVWTAEQARANHYGRGRGHLEAIEFPAGEEPQQSIADARVLRALSRASVRPPSSHTCRAKADCRLVDLIVLLARCPDETAEFDDETLDAHDIQGLVDYAERAFNRGKSEHDVKQQIAEMLEELRDDQPTADYYNDLIEEEEEEEEEEEDEEHDDNESDFDGASVPRRRRTQEDLEIADLMDYL